MGAMSSWREKAREKEGEREEPDRVGRARNAFAEAIMSSSKHLESIPSRFLFIFAIAEADY